MIKLACVKENPYFTIDKFYDIESVDKHGRAIVTCDLGTKVCAPEEYLISPNVLKMKCWGDHKPQTMTKGAAGIDLYNNGESVVCGDIVEIQTMTAIEIPNGYVGLVFVRSGLGFKGLNLINSCGVIDSDYRGEIGLKFTYVGEEPLELKHGDRVAQIVIVPYFKSHIISFVDELSDTERGENGFGSTGE